MKMTKTVTLDVDQYSIILVCIADELKSFQKVNESHQFDERIKHMKSIIKLINSAKTDLSYEN